MARTLVNRRRPRTESTAAQGAHVYRRDVGFAEEMLDDLLEVDLVGDDSVVFVVHRVIGAISAKDARTRGQLLGQATGGGIAVALRSMNVDGPYLPPHRRMFERRVGDQRDPLTWLGVAKATTQRLALADERTESVAVTICAAGAKDLEASGIDRVHEQAVLVMGGHAVPFSVC